MRLERNRWLGILVPMALLFLAPWSARAGDAIKWRSIGYGGGGNMVAVEVCPADADIVIAMSDVGGFYWSGDGGETWRVSNDVQVDPVLPATYGTAERVGFGFEPDTCQYAYSGARRSTDYGRTWQVDTNNSAMTGAAGGVIDPTDDDVVYAFWGGTVYRTSDGWRGQSCDGGSGGGTDCPASCSPSSLCYQLSCIPEPEGGTTSTGCTNFDDRIRAIVINPNDTDQLIACSDTGLYKSTDAAQTWSWLETDGLPHPDCNSLVLQNEGGTLTLYAALKTKPTTGAALGDNEWDCIDDWDGGIYKSQAGEEECAEWGKCWSAALGSDGPNLLPNPGFDTTGSPASGWTHLGASTEVTRQTTVTSPAGCGAPSAGYSIRFQYTSTNDFFVLEPVDPVEVEGGALYKISAKIMSNDSQGYPSIAKIAWLDEYEEPITRPMTPYSWINIWGHQITDSSGDFGWRRMEATVRAPDDAAYFRIQFLSGGLPSTYSGEVWLDDVSLRKAESLPQVSGMGDAPYLALYSDVVVDPTDADVLYTGIERGTGIGILELGEIAGIWKSTDGGETWSLSTRTNWHGNIVEGYGATPACGDHVCGGDWENCETCPVDCVGTGLPESPACCGDNSCDSGETLENCMADCPRDPGLASLPYRIAKYWFQEGTFYFAARGGIELHAWDIAIGGGETGHETLYFGSEHVKTTDGGDTWVEMSSSRHEGEPIDTGTWAAHGDANDVFIYPVVNDTRDGRDWVLYGDEDNGLMVSYNGGISFSREGWQWGGPSSWPGAEEVITYSTAATSIVLDAVNEDRIYVGASATGAHVYYNGSPKEIGTFYADYMEGTPPEVGHWDWHFLGDQASLPSTTGPVDLVQSGEGFVAAIYGKGVYRLAENDPGEDWVRVDDGDWGTYTPQCGDESPSAICWKMHRLYKAPTSGRLYVAVGSPFDRGITQDVSRESGIWESSDGGENWVLASDPDDDTGSGMDKEPVTDIVFLDQNTMLASTWNGHANNGDGGVYKGTRGGGDTWTWTKVLDQPIVTSLAVSPETTTVIYAFVGQTISDSSITGQVAGIYKSVNSGASFTLMSPNDGLMNLYHGRLYTSSGNPHRLYAGTIGSGLFEGTINCGPVAEGFADSDSDGTADCSDSQYDITAEVTPAVGTIDSGTYASLRSTSADDTHESLSEDDLAAPYKLEMVWTIANLPVGRTYTLNVEAYRNTGVVADNYDFKFTTRASGTCATSDGNGSTVLTVSKTSDDDQLQTGSLGAISNPVVCIRAQDTKRSVDIQQDWVAIDRIFLTLPAAAASADESTSPGSVYAGSNSDTATSNNTRETLRETSVSVSGGSTSRLVHTWRFDQVPAATSHTLHLEASRASNADGDDFKFSYSLDGVHFYPISGAVVSVTSEPSGGVDHGIAESIGGTWYIRVEDTDATVGNTTLDTLVVDHLTIVPVP